MAKLPRSPTLFASTYFFFVIIIAGKKSSIFSQKPLKISSKKTNKKKKPPHPATSTETLICSIFQASTSYRPRTSTTWAWAWARYAADVPATGLTGWTKERYWRCKRLRYFPSWNSSRWTFRFSPTSESTKVRYTRLPTYRTYGSRLPT